MARAAYRDPHNIQQGKKNVNTKNPKFQNRIFNLLIPFLIRFEKTQ